MYTVIKAQIVDQTMTLVSVPTLASGGVNEIRLECEFCSLWDGLGKVATFYRDKDNVYHVPLVNGTCIVPYEVTVQEGTFWLGVFGSGGTKIHIRTSEVVQLTVEQGAITQGTDPAEPTPDVYSQILAYYGEMEQGLAELSARMDTLVQTHGAGGTQTQSLTTTEFNKNGEECTIEVTSDGIHAWIKVLNVNLSIAAGQEVTLYNAYTGMRPIAYVEMCIYNGIAFGVSRGTDNTVNVSFRNTTNATANLQMFAISGVYPLDAPSLPELNDLRVGYDGTTYETAGAAVRAQIAALHDQGGGGDSGGGSGTITPPTLGDPEYLIVNGYMGLSEAKKALARRNIDAVASVNGRTPDENGNVDLTTLIPPSVDSAGGSGQHLVLVVDVHSGAPVWDQEYTFDQIYNAAEAGTLECYVGMNTDGNPSGEIDAWRKATLDVIISADARYGAKVSFNDTFNGYQYVWNSSGFAYYTIEVGSGGSGVAVSNIFSGKTASFYGDSLTETNYHYTKGYHSWVKDILGLASYNNYGASGYKVSDVYNRVKSVTNTSDIIFVMCGVNDQNFSVPLGAMGDNTSDTTYGALNLLCALLKQKYPTKLVVFITPHYQTKYPHNAGVTSYEVSKAIREVCEKYAIPVYDNFALSGIYSTNLSVFTTDNCHWNDVAHEMVGKNLSRFMLNTFGYLHGAEETKTLNGITAAFNQGTAVIYDTDSLSTLKQYLTVTANYSDGSKENVTSYTLSGTLSEGNSTITVAYLGYTASFTVTVTKNESGNEGGSEGGNDAPEFTPTFTPISSTTTGATYDDETDTLTIADGTSTFFGVIFDGATEVEISNYSGLGWFAVRDGAVYRAISTEGKRVETYDFTSDLKSASNRVDDNDTFDTTVQSIRIAIEGEAVKVYLNGMLYKTYSGDAIGYITSYAKAKVLNNIVFYGNATGGGSGDVEQVAMEIINGDSASGLFYEDQTLQLTSLNDTFGGVLFTDATEMQIDMRYNDGGFGWFGGYDSGVYHTMGKYNNSAETWDFSGDPLAATNSNKNTGIDWNVSEKITIRVENGNVNVYFDDSTEPVFSVVGTAIAWITSNVMAKTIYGVTFA